ncbi:glycosyltransferase family 39 protein [Skermania sp. ID1734]|nr:glycosyltransferase family 39 protein [Skermania sp. ID1734]
MGNTFYAGAAWAGSKNWEALLFGSVDTGNFITVDKPPVSQWVMGLSGQIFGFSSASMLVPQALMAVAAVALLYGAVSRVSSRGAGLLAGTVLAVMPVAALMFRFNNPDAVMVLLMMAGAYCTIRALQKASPAWFALAGVALGFAFLAKMLEGLMVLPALGIAYLIVAPTTLRKRILHSAGALAALVVSSGWYVLLTILWPASSRPYMAGSTDNSFMNLVLGYNGFARILGRNHGMPGGGHGMPENFHLPKGFELPHHAGHGGFGAGATGVSRLFNGEIGFEISWLLPAALLSFVLVLIARGRSPRTDLVRGAAIVFGLWLLVDGAVFSYMNGMFHAYYSLAVAPAIAGLVGLGVHEMWSARDRALGRYGSAALVLAAGVWGFVLLQRNSGWFPWLRWVILVVTILAAVALAVSSMRRFSVGFMALGLVAGLAGSTAYAVATLGQPHTGGSPSVGPADSDAGMRAFAAFFGEGSHNPALDAMLGATHTKWSAAIDRSSSAAALELSSDTAVMAIGGFMNDPVPTLAQFQDYVRNHEVTYYIVQARPNLPGMPQPGKPAKGDARGGENFSAMLDRFGGHQDIADWVAAHFTPTTVGSATVYDLTKYH